GNNRFSPETSRSQRSEPGRQKRRRHCFATCTAWANPSTGCSGGARATADRISRSSARSHDIVGAYHADSSEADRRAGGCSRFADLSFGSADHDYTESDSAWGSVALPRSPGGPEGKGRTVCRVDHSHY